MDYYTTPFILRLRRKWRPVWLVVLCWLLATGQGWSQAFFFNESFGTASATTAPTGWQIVDFQGNGQTWRFNNAGSRTITAPLVLPAAIIDSDNYGSGNTQHTALLTPTFSGVGINNAFLEFDHFYRRASSDSAVIEVFNGSTWVRVQFFATSTNDTGGGTNTPEFRSIDITNIVRNVANARVRFRFRGSFAWYWFVDNVRVRYTLSVPNDLTVSRIVAPSAVCSSSAINVPVTVRNTGTLPQSGVQQVGFQLFNASNVLLSSGTVNTPSVTLNPGDTTQAVVSVTLPSANGFYTLRAFTRLAGDQFVQNDTLSGTLTQALHDLNLTAYSQNFDGVSVLTALPGWSIANLNNDSGVWSLNTTNSRSAPNNLRYNFNGTNRANDWVFTNCFNMEAGKTYQISFWYRVSTSSTLAGDSLRFSVGTAASPIAMNTVLDLGKVNNTTYQRAQLNYTPPANGVYHFAWHAYSAPNRWNIHIDDFSILPPLNNDATITQVVPQGLGCDLNTTSSFNTVVKNIGLQALAAGIPVSYELRTLTNTLVSNGSQNTAQALAPGDSVVLSFNFARPAYGRYRLFVRQGLANDQLPANDTLSVAFVNGTYDLRQAAFLQNFDADLSLPVGWTVLNGNSDATTWQVFNSATLSRSTPNVLRCLTNTASAANDWVFTNCFYMEAGRNYTVSYWFRSGSATLTDEFTFAMGNAPNPAAMTTTLHNVSFRSTTYAQRQMVVTVPTTGFYYFGWRAHSLSNASGVYIDDFSIIPPLNNDLAVSRVSAPAVNCTPAATIPVPVTIRNNGLLAQAPLVPLTYELRNSANAVVGTGRDTLRVGLNPNDTSVVTLQVPSPGYGTYRIIARIQLANDMFTLNDTLGTALSQQYNDLRVADYVQNFDAVTNINRLTGWSVLNLNNDAQAWTLSTTTSRSTPNNLAITAPTSGTANDWVFSNCVFLEAGKAYAINFWFRHSSTTLRGRFSLHIGTAQTAAAMTTNLLTVSDFSNTVYERREVQFIPPTTGSYHLGFFTDIPSGQGTMRIDDLNIIAPKPNDVAVTSVEQVPGSNCQNTDVIPVQVRVRNVGSTVINTPVRVRFEATGAGFIWRDSALFNAPIAVLRDSLFAVNVPVTNRGNYTFTATAVASQDPVIDNNQRTASLSRHLQPMTTQGAVMSEGFEAATQITGLGGWTVVNANSDANTWTINTTSANANAGSNSLQIVTAAATAANDWVFSHCLRLSAANTYRLRIATRGQNTNAQVLQLSAGAATTAAGMTISIGTVNISTATYQNGEFFFNVPADGVYYLGLYATTPASTGAIFVDDIELTALFANDLTVINTVTSTTACDINSVPMTVTIRNVGSQAQPSNRIGLRLEVRQFNNSLVEAVDTVVGPFAFNETRTISLPVRLLPGTLHRVTSIIGLANDAQRNNDTLRRDVDSDAITLTPPPSYTIRQDGARLTLVRRSPILPGSQMLAVQWFHNRAAIPGATDTTYRLPSPAVLGEYYARIVFANGCVDISPTVIMDVTGRAWESLNGQVLLYPNPAREQITWQLSNANMEMVELHLYDATGAEKGFWQVSKGGELLQHVIGTETLPAGLYLLDVRQGKARGTYRFVKE